MATLEGFGQFNLSKYSLDIRGFREKILKRNLPEGAKVIRFAPSPTGFFTYREFICFFSRILFCFNKVRVYFYIRLEDTDTKKRDRGLWFSSCRTAKGI